MFKEIVSNEKNAMAIFEEDGRKEKQRMLSESLDLKQLKFYSLEGCRDFFYGFHGAVYRIYSDTSS